MTNDASDSDFKDPLEAIKSVKDKKQHHFLLVDDDPDSLQTIEEYLSSLGFNRVSKCRNGAEAVRVLERDPTITFIISDWDMPFMDGFSFLQRVRSQPQTAHIPFLIVTSPISHEAEKVMLAAENLVNAYIIKPFRLNVFKDKLEAILNLSVHGPQKQVIIVDDDDDARATVTEFLEKFGFKNIIPFKNGKEAIEYIIDNKENIDLIISDWEMPEMNGLDLLRSIRSSKKLEKIPFLMITSQNSMERMKVMQAAKSQVDQYLLKPFKAKDIKERVEYVLERARNKSDIDQLMKQAKEFTERGLFDRAVEKLQDATVIDPKNDLVWKALGEALHKAKGPDRALPNYKKAIEMNPYRVESYLKAASCYEQLGLIDKGLILLQTGIQHISFNADLHFQMGRFYHKKHMDRLARKEFEKTIELNLGHEEAKLMLQMLGPDDDKKPPSDD